MLNIFGHIIPSRRNKLKGTTGSSNGYTVMRNLNGNTMRGYIAKDGSGLLQDQNGNFYRVNTRW
jgi:hypothetical protein